MENNLVMIEFDALPTNQSFARSVTAAYCASLDPTVEELTELKTAVSEAVSNAIIHGYDKSGVGKIKMEMKTLDKDKVFVKVMDNGKGISDVKKAMEPMYSTEDEKEMSGMGFTVMESFVDKVFVESEPGQGTVVTLIKCLDTFYGL